MWIVGVALPAPSGGSGARYCKPQRGPRSARPAACPLPIPSPFRGRSRPRDEAGHATPLAGSPGWIFGGNMTTTATRQDKDLNLQIRLQIVSACYLVTPT
jgi:hypothetical protein